MSTQLTLTCPKSYRIFLIQCNPSLPILTPNEHTRVHLQGMYLPCLANPVTQAMPLLTLLMSMTHRCSASPCCYVSHVIRTITLHHEEGLETVKPYTCWYMVKSVHVLNPGYSLSICYWAKKATADHLLKLMFLLWRSNWVLLYLTQHGAVSLGWGKGQVILTHEQSGKTFFLEKKEKQSSFNVWCCQALLPEQQQGCSPAKHPAAGDWWSSFYTSLSIEADSEIYLSLITCSGKS